MEIILLLQELLVHILQVLFMYAKRGLYKG